MLLLVNRARVITISIHREVMLNIKSITNFFINHNFIFSGLWGAVHLRACALRRRNNPKLAWALKNKTRKFFYSSRPLITSSWDKPRGNTRPRLIYTNIFITIIKYRFYYISSQLLRTISYDFTLVQKFYFGILKIRRELSKSYESCCASFCAIHNVIHWKW